MAAAAAVVMVVVVVIVATAGTRGMKGARERERARRGRGMRVALLLAYVRYACASVDQVEGDARAGRVVGRLGGLGVWPMTVASERW